jgi:hypothetical protein
LELLLSFPLLQYLFGTLLTEINRDHSLRSKDNKANQIAIKGMDDLPKRSTSPHIPKTSSKRKREKRKHIIQMGAGKKQGWPMPLKIKKYNRPLALALLFSRARLPSRDFFR